MNIYDCRNSCGGCCAQVESCACREPEPCCRPVECRPVECRPVCQPVCCCEPEPCCRPGAAASYAMFTLAAPAAGGGTLTLTPALIGPGGQIAAQSPGEVYLAQGHVYEVICQVTAAAAAPGGSFTVTPLLNAAPQPNSAATASIPQEGGSASAVSVFLVSGIQALNLLSLSYSGAAAGSLSGSLIIREIA